MRAFKEAGVWKAEHEAHNQALLKRQQVLADRVGRVPEDAIRRTTAAFAKGWLSARAAALTKSGPADHGRSDLTGLEARRRWGDSHGERRAQAGERVDVRRPALRRRRSEAEVAARAHAAAACGGGC